MSGRVEFYRKTERIGEVDCVEPNLNLLAHAQMIELAVGSRCGGHGKCGGDRVRILSGSVGALSPLTESEGIHLSTDEIAQGYRLACQCFPSDASSVLLVEVF